MHPVAWRPRSLFLDHLCPALLCRQFVNRAEMCAKGSYRSRNPKDLNYLITVQICIFCRFFFCYLTCRIWNVHYGLMCGHLACTYVFWSYSIQKMKYVFQGFIHGFSNNTELFRPFDVQKCALEGYSILFGSKRVLHFCSYISAVCLFYRVRPLQGLTDNQQDLPAVCFPYAAQAGACRVLLHVCACAVRLWSLHNLHSLPNTTTLALWAKILT